MDPEDDVCLCFHVTRKKIVNFLKRENPPVASLMSECLGAGTGCMWCVPFLKRLHEMHQAGLEPDLPFGLEEYAERRAEYRTTGRRTLPSQSSGDPSGDRTKSDDGPSEPP